MGEVERRADISYEEFNRSYSAKGRPVIITDYAQRLLGDPSGDSRQRQREQEWSLDRLHLHGGRQDVGADGRGGFRPAGRFHRRVSG